MARTLSDRTMRAAIIEAPGAIRVGDRPYPVVVEATDAVVRVVLTCVCGGDLWQTDLEGIAGAYAAMDERRAIKSLVRVGTV